MNFRITSITRYEPGRISPHVLIHLDATFAEGNTVSQPPFTLRIPEGEAENMKPGDIVSLLLIPVALDTPKE